MNSAPSRAAALARRCSSSVRGRLRAHRHRDPACRLFDHRFRDLAPARRRSWSKNRRPRRRRAACRISASMPRSRRKRTVAPGRREIELQIGIAEHRRDGDVAPFEPLPGPLEIHASAPRATSRPVVANYRERRSERDLALPRRRLDIPAKRRSDHGASRCWETMATQLTQSRGSGRPSRLRLPPAAGIPDLRPHSWRSRRCASPTRMPGAQALQLAPVHRRRPPGDGRQRHDHRARSRHRRRALFCRPSSSSPATIRRSHLSKRRARTGSADSTATAP